MYETQFIALHELFDEIAEGADEYVDLIESSRASGLEERGSA